MTGHVLAANVQIGEHITRKFLGMTINVDTVYSTLIAGGLLVLAGVYIARRASQGTPSKLQLAFETVVDAVQTQVEDSIGNIAPFVVPLAVTLFLLILTANWIEIVPTGHHPEYVPPPSADVNFTFALSLLVFVLSLATGIRHRGIGGYAKGLFSPKPWLFPLNVLEELIKPITLSLRLFGNIFAGGVMLVVISLLPAYLLWFPNGLWKLFDLFIGAIQAFIFALLTILYFAFAAGEGGH